MKMLLTFWHNEHEEAGDTPHGKERTLWEPTAVREEEQNHWPSGDLHQSKQKLIEVKVYAQVWYTQRQTIIHQYSNKPTEGKSE